VTRESLTPDVTFEDVVGQEEAKRVLEAAIIKPFLEGVPPLMCFCQESLARVKIS